MKVSGIITNLGINCVTTNPNTHTKKDSNINTNAIDARVSVMPQAEVLKAYYLSKNNNIAFRGAPWKLDLYHLGIPNYGSISADEAIRIFSKFKLGNYLDIGEDKLYYYSNKAIRDENLSFLDRITNPEEKRKFIKYYMDLTGFPNLREVSTRIRAELISAIRKSINELNGYNSNGKFKVLQAGYDGVCSVGKGKALPGSDIDKAYIILKDGYGYDAEDMVNRFKGKLWENTDQRILSYNHDDAAFPQVYTEGQFFNLFNAAEKVAIENYRESIDYGILDIISIGLGFPNYKSTAGLHKLKSVKTYYDDNYVRANQFFIDICKKFPRHYNDRIDVLNPSRENIKNLGFMIEAMREGEKFYVFDCIPQQRIENSMLYKYTNLSQLSALKQRSDQKAKRIARENLVLDFPKWDVDKQFRFIKTLINGSCGNNTNFTTEFPQYFSKSGEDPFAPLIKALMEG